METQYRYVEYRKTPWRKKGESPTLLDKKDCRGKEGFISCYCIDEEGKKWIEEQGHCQGFPFPVWSKFLFVDFDDKFEAAKAFKDYLIANSITFTEWDSGNRSIHFHILREVEPSKHLPNTDWLWITEHAPEADRSLYAKGGLHPYRLPGTVHENTGRPKKLLYKHQGKPLHLEIQEEKPIEESQAVDTEGNSSLFIDSRVMRNINGFVEGARYFPTLKLASYLSRQGYTSEFVEQWIREVNKLSYPPLPEDRLLKIFRSILWRNNE